MAEPMINVNFKEVLLKQCSCKIGEMNPNEKYNIGLEDLAEVKDVKIDGFTIRYTRRTLSNVPFFCETVYEFDAEIDKKDLVHFDNDVQKVKDFAERKKINMINSLALPSRASLLIGNMVNETGTPFLSIPSFILKKEDTIKQ